MCGFGHRRCGAHSNLGLPKCVVLVISLSCTRTCRMTWSKPLLRKSWRKKETPDNSQKTIIIEVQSSGAPPSNVISSISSPQSSISIVIIFLRVKERYACLSNEGAFGQYLGSYLAWGGSSPNGSFGSFSHERDNIKFKEGCHRWPIKDDWNFMRDVDSGKSFFSSPIPLVEPSLDSKVVFLGQGGEILRGACQTCLFLG